ncbi:MAG: RNA polymerase sigma factor [Schlesneria sp.]
MDDQTLLSQYVATQDSGAFEELTRRYAGLVKGVCVRLLGNSHDAEEVAQECFLELARNAAEVHTSLGGWLRSAATSRSLNAIRSRSRRKIREREFSHEADATVPPYDLTGTDLQRLIQVALRELPEELRRPMMMHYVEGQSQRDVAAELGVNQSTISRRMRDALRQLRERLTQAGYAATPPAMMVLMQEHAAAAGTTSELTDVIASETAGKAVGGATLGSTLKGLVVAVFPVAAMLVLDGWVSLVFAVCVTLYVARYRPIWASDVMSSLGSNDFYDQPTYFLKRWTWTTPPKGWRTQACVSAAWSIFFFGLSLLFAFATPRPMWGTALLGLLIAMFLVCHALRLIIRVHSIIAFNSPGFQQTHHGSIAPSEEAGFWNAIAGLSRNDPSLSWFDVVQLVAIGLGGLGISASFAVHSGFNIPWPSILLSATTGAGMLCSGIWRCKRLVNRRRVVAASQSVKRHGMDRSNGTQTVLAMGVTIVVAMSGWIVWNPASVRGASQSLAAIQASMFGWLIYRIAARYQGLEPSVIRRLAIILLGACFALNSGVCLANWFPMEFRH